LAARPLHPALLALLAGAVVASLTAAALGAGVPLILTSWASSMALIVTATDQPAAHPARVAGGHVVSGLVGLGLVLAFGHLSLTQLAAGPGAAELARACALVGAGVTLALGAMMLTGALHPPAAANPLIILVSGAATPSGALLLLVMGAAMLALVAFALRRHLRLHVRG
jgi:CBS-domain-containing membrane protein